MTREDMERLTSHTDVKAERIRILFKADVPRAEIATFLGITYQHVQNVLKRSGLLRPKTPEAVIESGELWVARVEQGGRITLPAAWVSETGLRTGDVLVCRPDGNDLRLVTRAAAADALREAARRHMPDQAALLEAFIGDAERTRST